MPILPFSSRSSFPRGVWFLIILIPTVMIPLGFVDFEWTLVVYRHRNELFGELMKRTFFNGWKFGFSDPAIVFLILNAICYFLYSPKRKNNFFHRYRPYFGFIFFTSLVTGLGLVHSFKWVIGRARPNLVLKDGLPFSQWFEFGPQFVSDGVFYGSFPSGHTATVFLLVTLSYILISDPRGSKLHNAIGWIWGGIVFICSVLMSLGRAMTLDHWLTDCAGIILMAWLSIQLIFFHILKIPNQVSYIKANGRYAPLPLFWELMLLWRLFLITIGVMSVIIGVRAVILQKAPWLVLIVIPGSFLVYRFTRSLRQVYGKLMVYFSN